MDVSFHCTFDSDKVSYQIREFIAYAIALNVALNYTIYFSKYDN